MIEDDELQLNNWDEVLDHRISFLRQSIEAERKRLESRGANPEQIEDSLRNQRAMLRVAIEERFALFVEPRARMVILIPSRFAVFSGNSAVIVGSGANGLYVSQGFEARLG